MKPKKSAEDKNFADAKQYDNNVFNMMKQIRKESKDFTGGSYLKDKNWNLCFTNAATGQAWQDHYENNLNTK